MRELLGVRGGVRKPVATPDVDHALEAARGGLKIGFLVVDVRKEPKGGCFSNFIAQLDEVLGRIVEAAFGLDGLARVKKDPSELAVACGQSRLIAHDAAVKAEGPDWWKNSIRRY